MKNKGFVFVETIIVTTVLTVALLAIYSSFLNVLTNEKRRATYNDTEYLYRTYYLEDFLVSLNLNQYINKYIIDNNRSIVEFSCSDTSLYNTTKIDANANTIITDKAEIAKEQFCESMINTGKLNVKHIYITKYNVSDLKACTTSTGKVTCSDSSVEALKGVSSNFIYYLRTISAASTTVNDYRLLVEYEETEYDDSMTKTPTKNTCPTNYTLINSTCVRTITKNYYSSVKMVIKGE